MKSFLKHKDLIHRHVENGSEHDHVVERRHRLAPLPLVDGLRIGEAEDRLKITDRHSGVLPKPGDVQSGRGHVDDGYEVQLLSLLSGHWAGRKPAQLALKL